MTSTVLITGASQGIGKATALRFAKEGFNVVLAARQLDRLEAVANEIRSMGREAIAIPTDVQEWEQVKALVEGAIAHFGQIDVLVNNAGVYDLGPVDQATLEEWHEVIQTNVWGYIYTIHALLPHFLSRQSGTIVNVCSIGGLNPIPYQVPYTTSKFAISGLTKSLREELKPKGVQVCGIYPSFIRTQVMERAHIRGYTEETTKARRDLLNTALNSPFLETPEDVATAIWKSVKQGQSEVVVGTAKLWTAAYHAVPGMIQPIFRRVFGMDERRESTPEGNP